MEKNIHINIGRQIGAGGLDVARELGKRFGIKVYDKELLALAANALLAFIVAQRKFVFRSQLALFWVITMYVNGGMIPTLLLYQKLKG